ncbi:kinase-like domain-containing protein [Panaeolus papilionaceus]|nr:kinase-like domain-containing protein [Panaeolus papilionaceus]
MLGQLIAEGSFGQVYVLEIKPKKVAKVTPITSTVLNHEYQAYNRLRNIPGIVGHVTILETNTTRSLIMEHVGNPLSTIAFHKMAMQHRLPLIARLLCKLLLTVNLMHKRDVIHGDISPSNVTIAPPRDRYSRSRIFLIDFGASMISGRTEGIPHTSTRFASHWRLSSATLAPSTSDDLLSLANCILFLIKGELPWDKECENFEQHPTPANLETVIHVKASTSPEILCAGLPVIFLELYQAVLKLEKSADKLDYMYFLQHFYYLASKF